MRKYIVSTHLGDFATTAATPEKAISNIRWRIFGCSARAGRYTQNWTVRAVA